MFVSSILSFKYSIVSIVYFMLKMNKNITKDNMIKFCVWGIKNFLFATHVQFDKCNKTYNFYIKNKDNLPLLYIETGNARMYSKRFLNFLRNCRNENFEELDLEWGASENYYDAAIKITFREEEIYQLYNEIVKHDERELLTEKIKSAQKNTIKKFYR